MKDCEDSYCLDDVDPYADVPGIWLDELEDAPPKDETVVVLNPAVLYGDTWAPPLLDEMLYAHRAATADDFDFDELDT